MKITKLNGTTVEMEPNKVEAIRVRLRGYRLTETRCFERDNESVLISEYGFEWYVDNKRVRTGVVENINEDIESLINEGFAEVA